LQTILISNIIETHQINLAKYQKVLRILYPLGSMVIL